jgi:hypothetical protein
MDQAFIDEDDAVIRMLMTIGVGEQIVYGRQYVGVLSTVSPRVSKLLMQLDESKTVMCFHRRRKDGLCDYVAIGVTPGAYLALKNAADREAKRLLAPKKEAEHNSQELEDALATCM